MLGSQPAARSWYCCEPSLSWPLEDGWAAGHPPPTVPVAGSSGREWLASSEKPAFTGGAGAGGTTPQKGSQMGARWELLEGWS